MKKLSAFDKAPLWLQKVLRKCESKRAAKENARLLKYYFPKNKTKTTKGG